MLFYRAPTSSAPKWPNKAIRALTVVALAAYPIGALTIAASGQLPDFETLSLVGYAFVAIAFFAALPVLGSPLQRITADTIKELDERELHLRYRATSVAYWIFCGVVLLALIYMAVASDHGWWQPTGYDGFNGIFWGAFLYATLLPTAVLAWTMQSKSEID